MTTVLSLVLLIFLSLPTQISGWISSTSTPQRYCYHTGITEVASLIHHCPRQSSSFLHSSSNDNDDAEPAATPLSLSPSDLERLSQLRRRQKIGLPIMVLDAMLPGQRLEFSLRDQRFRVLAKHLLLLEETDEASLGMVGFDPVTGDPLNVGVTVKILKLEIDDTNNSCTLGIEADAMFQVQNEPQMDATESYYTVDVEMVEGCSERALTVDEQLEAKRLHDNIPDLIQEWLALLYQTGRATPENMEQRYPFLNSNGMPEHDIGARAVWAAALINPIPSLGVCLEIRPSMLVCQNDLERVRLAHASIAASIDHVSGKQRLF